MSFAFVPLALLMAAVTYPSRALPLLVPVVDRLPPVALAYLRLVGPACLAALVAVNTLLATGGAGTTLHADVEWLAVAACIAVVLRWRNVLPGIVAAMVLVAGARALGLA